MIRAAACLLMALALCPRVALGFVVEGTVFYPEDGPIRLMLVNQEQYQENTDSDFGLVIQPEESGPGVVAYRFTDVPAGTYAIKGFQDVDRNGEPDEGLFGPSEPWGFYRPCRPWLRAPRFDEVSFTLNRDIKNAHLELED